MIIIIVAIRPVIIVAIMNIYIYVCVSIRFSVEYAFLNNF